MSNIPKSRQHLLELLERNFTRLLDEIDDLDPQDAQLMCDAQFSIKDILAVRRWWADAVVGWVQDGKRGKRLTLPAEGFTWRETPALNLQTARKCRKISYRTTVKRLIASHDKVVALIDSLSDRELTRIGVFQWAGKWPVMRWISVSTASQYDGARKLIRQARKTAQRD